MKHFSLKAVLCLFALCLICAAAFPVSAAASVPVWGSCSDTVNWTLDKDSGIITISGTGAMPDYASGEAPWYGDRMSVKTIRVEDGITAVGAYAFSYAIYADTVVLADSVSVIGSNAFAACCELSSVRMPGVTKIGSHAFADCNKRLENISWPLNLSEIGDYAFYGCTMLKAPVFTEHLTSVGMYAFAYCNGITELSLPESLVKVGDYAFDSCKSLRSVSLPDSMTRLSAFMFRGCSSLTQAVLPQGLTSVSPYAFADCVNLAWVWIPDGVTAIGQSAFECCSGLERILLPGSVCSIGKGAFYHCLNLSTACYFGSESMWSRVAVASCNEPLLCAEFDFDPHTYTECKTVSPRSCTADGILAYTAADGACRTETVRAAGHAYEKAGSTLWRCSICGDTHAVPSGTAGYGSFGPGLEWLLTTDGTLSVSGEGPMPNVGVRTSAPWYGLRNSVLRVKVNSGVTYVGSEAFTYCTRLTGVTLADTVTEIGESAFDACYALQNVTLPSQLAVIGKQAFFDCYMLPEILLPDSLSVIGEYAFYNCEALSAPHFPAGLKSIGQWAFAYCDTFTEVTIPAETELLGDYAFDSCKSLRSAALPDSLTYLGIYAFRGCKQLESACIPKNIPYIGQNTFDGCTALTSVTIPSSVTEIGKSAFYNCSALHDVYYGGTAAKWAEVIVSPVGNAPLLGSVLHCIKPETPKAPSNLKAVNKSDGVCLTWDPAEGTGNYVILRDGVQTGTSADASYTDKSAKSGVVYSYSVKAVAGETASAPSDAAVIMFLAVPENVKCVCEAEGIRVSWDAVDGATGYTLYRRLSTSDTWTSVFTSTEAATLSKLDKGVTDGRTYFYTVRANFKSTDGNTRYTSVMAASAEKIECNLVSSLDTPTIKSVTNGFSSILVKWTKVSGADGYYIYRRTEGSDTWTKLKTITQPKSGSTVSFGNTKSDNGTVYTYKAVAYRGTTVSSDSNEKSYMRLTYPTLTASSTTAGKITLRWTGNEYATSFQIEYTQGESFTGATRKTLTSYKTSTAYSGLESGTEYRVRVRAYVKYWNEAEGRDMFYYGTWSNADGTGASVQSVTVK